MFKQVIHLLFLFTSLLFVGMVPAQLLAGQRLEGSIGKVKQKTRSAIQWGDISGDETNLKTFLDQDSLVITDSLCVQNAIAGFALAVIYNDTSALSFKLSSNKITTEIKESIKRLPNVSRIIIEDIRIACNLNGKEHVRYSKVMLTYTILEK